MAKQLIVFGIILFINLLIVILYLVWNLLLRKKENKGSYWMRAIVMLLCPIVKITSSKSTGSEKNKTYKA